MAEKPCERCGRSTGYDTEMHDSQHENVCIECWLKNECVCPDGRFKIYLPNYSVKIVDLEEYEAARKIFGYKTFIISNLDEDPRRVTRRKKPGGENV